MIYLMRHGEIKTSGGKRYVGQTDIPLNEKGIAKAKQWRQALRSVKFNRIVCSDLSRTRETARIIAGDRRISVNELPAFREINLGLWDGQLMSDIKARYPEAWNARGQNIAEFRPPGGESFTDLLERAFPAFEYIASQPYENVLIVAHAGVNRVLLCNILSIPLKNLFMLGQDYSCLNLLRLGCSWKVIAVNRAYVN